MHLKVSPNNNNNHREEFGSPLFVKPMPSSLDRLLQWFHFEVWSSDALSKTSDIDLPRKLVEDGYTINIKSYVNGLAVLHVSRSCSVHVPKIMLWNPSIRKTLELPLPPGFAPFQDHGLDGRWQMLCLELGYDPITKDYKVLALIRNLGKLMLVKDFPAYARVFMDPRENPDNSTRFFNPPSSVKVYTLSTGAWRNIWSMKGNASDDDNDDDADDKARFWWYVPKFLNGVIYWIGLDTRISNRERRFKAPRIVSFDIYMSLEVFKWTTKLPAETEQAETEKRIRDPTLWCHLGVMDESLVFVKCAPEHISVWLMNHSTQSVEERPWSKLWTIVDDLAVLLPWERPKIFITNSGMFNFLPPGSPTCYDIRRRLVRNHYNVAVVDAYYIVMAEYVVSLALFKHGKPY